ncbi:MAG: hypothetical protein JKX75_09825 [Gammaproteobacteria bacterium]|nr:hypothetical protein [Gammaproteobacteria bacterium]
MLDTLTYKLVAKIQATPAPAHNNHSALPMELLQILHRKGFDIEIKAKLIKFDVRQFAI